MLQYNVFLIHIYVYEYVWYIIYRKWLVMRQNHDRTEEISVSLLLFWAAHTGPEKSNRSNVQNGILLRGGLAGGAA